MADLDLDRLEAGLAQLPGALRTLEDSGFHDNYTDAARARSQVYQFDQALRAAAPELLRRARELERRDVILRRLVAAVDVTRAKNATPAHEKELDDALDVAREVL